MAQELDDGEFWLPSEFLTDDDLLMDFKTDCFKTKRSDDLSYGFGTSFGFNTDLSSPVESVMGSTETESDEDDFITFLTRKIAYSNLQDSKFISDYPTKGPKLSGSPQSTLCGHKPGSSRGSPKCISRISSPLDVTDAVGWDLLYAAGEVARMRVNEQTTAFYPTKILSTPLKPCPITVPRANPSPGFYPNHKTQAPLSYQQLQATQLQQMTKSGIWGQEKLRSQFHNGRINGGEERTQDLLAAAWPTLQQPQQQPQQLPRSGMRAVFLGENGVKKDRTGTGVFLPRRYGTNSNETRKKPVGCSTVLLPDRVVHALNLSLESIDAPAQAQCQSQFLSRGNANFTTEYDAALKINNYSIPMTQQRRNLRPQPVMNQEFWLPQEWTY